MQRARNVLAEAVVGRTRLEVAWLAANAIAIPILALIWWHVASHPWHNDAYAFWNAWTDGSLYPPTWQPVSEYVYSPAFAQAFWPLTELRFSLVNAAWALLQLLVLVWMLGPAGALIALAVPIPNIAGYGGAAYGGPVYASLYNGNPMILTAGAITLGLTRWPGAFAYVLLTKVSAGVGIAWFAVRREWRNLAIALGTTAAITAVSVVLAPGLWADWLSLLAGAVIHSGSSGTLDKELFVPVALAIRGPIGLALIALAGWRGWAWLVAVGCFLARPDIHLGGFAVLAAVPAIWWRTRTPLSWPPCRPSTS